MAIRAPLIPRPDGADQIQLFGEPKVVLLPTIAVNIVLISCYFLLVLFHDEGTTFFEQAYEKAQGLLPIFLRAGVLKIGWCLWLGWHIVNVAGIVFSTREWPWVKYIYTPFIMSLVNVQGDAVGRFQTHGRWVRIIGINIIIFHVYFGTNVMGDTMFVPSFIPGHFLGSLFYIFVDTIGLWLITSFIGQSGILHYFSDEIRMPSHAPDDPIGDTSIYLTDDTQSAVPIFVMQLMLLIMFMQDADAKSADAIFEDTGDLKNHVQFGFWICGTLVQLLVAGTGDNMSSPFSYDAWAKKTDALREHPCQMYSHLIMDYIVNSWGWNNIMYMMPLLSSLQPGTDDFIQNILVFCFIVKIDNFASNAGNPG